VYIVSRCGRSVRRGDVTGNSRGDSKLLKFTVNPLCQLYLTSVLLAFGANKDQRKHSYS